MVLCPTCSVKLRRTYYKEGVDKAMSLQFICKIGNTVLWFCSSCHNYYFKRYSKYHPKES